MPEAVPVRLLRPAIPLFPKPESRNLNGLILISFRPGRTGTAAGLRRAAWLHGKRSAVGRVERPAQPAIRFAAVMADYAALIRPTRVLFLGRDACAGAMWLARILWRRRQCYGQLTLRNGFSASGRSTPEREHCR